ncbi:DUF2090 domain-containing protein [Candidatus Micrarchaeota archaeon]|nr:DUF2090 domain-containing protein [Candidatus Micrarchaeota archaeon]
MLVGYSKELLILAFDHRGSFQKKLFGIEGVPTPEQTIEISAYKRIIYAGFERAIQQGVPKASAGILIDEQFGSPILEDAKRKGYTFAMPIEKSGQNEFDFEYGTDYAKHIEHFNPSFAKVLVRYNPEDDSELKKRQQARLKQLTRYLHDQGRLFLFELLVPASEKQLREAGGNTETFDEHIRPKLMIQCMSELQQAGVQPDVWKLEGLVNESDVQAVVRQARSNLTNAGIVTLGRGANDEKVRQWLKASSGIAGVIGFAVGRTIFWDALNGFKEQKHSSEQAVQMIADKYAEFVRVWKAGKGE